MKFSEIAYDANGNTLTDAQGRSYTWDFENRLTQAVVPGTNGGTTTFKYDPFGRRIQKSGPLGTTNYLYDGMGNLIEALDASGNVLAKYNQGSDVDEHLAQVQSGTATYYNQDPLNSVTSLSNAAGALVETYNYDSFGKLVGSTGNLAPPFQFTGREFDQETGLYYHRARYYDPANSRFLNEDPLQFEGGLNFYAYADNNPANETDPFGLRSTYQCTITGVCWKRPKPHPECGWLDPGCFRYHGNWCGPTWTGGRVESYNPDHDSLYKPPDEGDALDSACENHDKCYYHCRKDHPCDKEARKQCMIQCDRVLAGEAAASGHQYSSPLWWWMEHSPTEDAGSNESCGCKEKQGGSK